ncbi:MAG: selenide, water dikinase SelD [Alphaproteobacteria bacterium]
MQPIVPIVPIVKDLVLIGGGHSHVAVLKSFGMKPMPGVRLTLISGDAHTPYSGMLPGLLAGHYGIDDAHIDLGPLSRFAAARFIRDEAVALDLEARRVACREHPPISFDVLSLDIGAAPDMAGVPGAEGRVVPVKPIHRFLGHWQALVERVRARGGTTRIGVVGAGAGGVELLLAAQYRLRQSGAAPAFHLFSDGADILPSHNRLVRRKFRAVLAARGIAVHAGQAVVAVESGRLRLADGNVFALEEILWTTPAGAAAWLKETGLALDARGFVAVGDGLESLSHKGVFAAGDIAAVIDHPRPKAGVFAVRQGKPLARNLRRALVGQMPRPFTPQRRFLSLISTGDKYAVASRGSWAFWGPAAWRWKDAIDRRFMRRYNELPEMRAPGVPAMAPGLADEGLVAELAAGAMRCGGCGAKIASTVLERALARLRPLVRPDVLIGLEAADDAAVVAVPAGKLAVHSVDYFRAFIADPYLFGKIAANHALGDIFAMGAEPQTALAIVTLPYGSAAKLEEELFHLMAGALAVLGEAGTALVGGHTSEGAELALGFAVNGIAAPERLLRKGGMRPGDRLLLSKPLGTGTLLAADMRGKAKGRWIEAALSAMVQSNGAAAACLQRHGATACTDVTGFGLIGHLMEMIKPSRVAVELSLAALPWLDGALETARLGLLSSLQPENAQAARAIAAVERWEGDEHLALLFDPQTAGGLLASVPERAAEACLGEMRQLGYLQAALIGRVTEPGEAARPIAIVE